MNLISAYWYWITATFYINGIHIEGALSNQDESLLWSQSVLRFIKNIIKREVLNCSYAGFHTVALIDTSIVLRNDRVARIQNIFSKTNHSVSHQKLDRVASGNHGIFHKGRKGIEIF